MACLKQLLSTAPANLTISTTAANYDSKMGQLRSPASSYSNDTCSPIDSSRFKASETGSGSYACCLCTFVTSSIDDVWTHSRIKHSDILQEKIQEFQREIVKSKPDTEEASSKERKDQKASTSDDKNDTIIITVDHVPMTRRKRKPLMITDPIKLLPPPKARKRGLSEITEALLNNVTSGREAPIQVNVLSTSKSEDKEDAPLVNILKKGITKRKSSNALSTLAATSSSKHNDTAYYPNIQCLLCKEWVCARNRYMHVESHLQYRPYKCSVCRYDNRKEIFISLHISKFHDGHGTVLYEPDLELEKHAWELAEKCLQHTRNVLMSNPNADATRNQQTGTTSTTSDANQVDPTFEAVYRPKIFNSSRLEKTQLIEHSRELGLVPDFSEARSRESSCQLCQSHIMKNGVSLEDHVRFHLSRASYSCAHLNCSIQHCSRNFIMRHMKEVHRIRYNPKDHFEDDDALLNEFVQLATVCFPNNYTNESVNRIKSRYANGRSDLTE